MRHQSAFRTPAFEQISEKPALIYSDVFWALEDQLVSVDLKVAFHLVYLLLPSPSTVRLFAEIPDAALAPVSRRRRSMSIVCLLMHLNPFNPNNIGNHF